MYYRESDGTVTKDKYIRAILEDGSDIMILSAPFWMLTDYLQSGGEIAPAPEPEIIQTNLEMVSRLKAGMKATDV